MRIGRLYELNYESSLPKIPNDQKEALYIFYERWKYTEILIEQALYVGRRHRGCFS